MPDKYAAKAAGRRTRPDPGGHPGPEPLSRLLGSGRQRRPQGRPSQSRSVIAPAQRPASRSPGPPAQPEATRRPGAPCPRETTRGAGRSHGNACPAPPFRSSQEHAASTARPWNSRRVLRPSWRHRRLGQALSERDGCYGRCRRVPWGLEDCRTLFS